MSATWHAAEIIGSDVRRINGETVLDLRLRSNCVQVKDRIVLLSSSAHRLSEGNRRLSTLCHAVGWFAPLIDSDQLYGWTCRVQAPIGRVVAYAPDPRLVMLASAEPMGCA